MSLLRCFVKKMFSFPVLWLGGIYRSIYRESLKKQLGFCGNNVSLGVPNTVFNLQNMFLHDNTSIYDGFNFISVHGKFVMKENSGAAQGLTVITESHKRYPDYLFLNNDETTSVYKDIIVEEEVWLASNVTLIDGCHIGRGASIGAGSVVRSNIPPYAIAIGNPAKVVGFAFTPDQVKEHEDKYYKIDSRTDINQYENDYYTYFVSRRKNIREYYRIKL